MKDKKVIVVVCLLLLAVLACVFFYTKKDSSTERELLYTIKYDGIDCMTPEIYLYDDNTYEFYYTYAMEGIELVPKTGKYNYDISKIINNIDKYGEDPAGPYIIKTKDDEQYITYGTNKELREFLDSLNLEFEKCLEVQE